MRAKRGQKKERTKANRHSAADAVLRDRDCTKPEGPQRLDLREGAGREGGQEVDDDDDEPTQDDRRKKKQKKRREHKEGQLGEYHGQRQLYIERWEERMFMGLLLRQSER